MTSDSISPQTVPLTIGQALQQAISHHQAVRLPDAERLYRNILQLQPNHPEANHNLGVLAVQLKQPAAGLSHLKKALDANPNQAQYWLSYIDALIQAGQTAVAKHMLAQGRQRGLSGKEVDQLADRLHAPSMEYRIAPLANPNSPFFIHAVPKFNISHVSINVFHKLYEDLIDALSGGLIDLGYSCSVRKNAYVGDSINIFLGSTVFASRLQDLPNRLHGKPYIVYQLEQLHSKKGLLQEWPEYYHLLKNATAIWDYSPSGVRFLKDKGFNNVYYVPPSFHRSMESFGPRQHQDIDVLFYGSPHDRRHLIMSTLHNLGVKIDYLTTSFGDERNTYIARAKIILNIHAWDNLDALETVRLSFILANRGFIISEEGDHNPYGDGVVFSPYDQLVNICLRYLQEPRQVRDEIAQKGYLALRKQEMANILSSVLDSMDFSDRLAIEDASTGHLPRQSGGAERDISSN
jgi:tetratricopeptide (TPR) repeat protein